MGERNNLLSGNVVLAIFLVLWAVVLICVNSAHAADKKPPVTRYWLSVATEKSAFPGMPEGMPGIGGMFGKGGSGKQLRLQLNSPRQQPAEPKATHDIPPGQRMGDTLPLMIPERQRGEAGEKGQPGMVEKPKMRMLVYWGCGENVRQGQPRVLDTGSMSLAEFGRAMGGHQIKHQSPPSPDGGRTYADWPNETDSTSVPGNSSLVGGHYVHGNYVPDIRFSIDEKHDFMAPVEFTSVSGTPRESFRFQWDPISSATGYFAMAMGHDQNTGTTILWSSSEVPGQGYAMMDYLPDDEVRRLIKSRNIMPPSVTQCSIPKGIFKDAEGAIIQFIAYGEELNLSYPVKPKDPVWAVKVRRKSTGMLPLMEMEGRGMRNRRADRNAERNADDEESAPARREGTSPGKVLRGILGF